MTADPFRPLIAPDGSFLPQPVKAAKLVVDPAEMRARAAEIGASLDAWKTKPRKATARSRSFAVIKEEMLRPLYPGLLWRGKYSVFAGDPGLGKSVLCNAELPARLTRGGKVSPHSDDVFEPVNVGIASSEDGAEDTLAPRLRIAGADMNRVFNLEGIFDADGNLQHLDMGRHLAAIDDFIAEHKLSLMVLDPISSFFGKIDSNSQTDVRGVVDPMKAILEKHACALLGVMHLNKAGGMAAIYRLGGSISMVGAPRAAFGFVRDESQGSKSDRLLLPIKVNLAPEDRGFAMRIANCDGYPKIEWSPVRPDISVNEALGAKPPTQADRAVLALQDVLLPGREVPASTIDRICAERNIGEKARAAALKKLNASKRHEGGKNGKAGWYWSVPNVEVADGAQWVEDGPRAEEVAEDARASLTEAADAVLGNWI